MNLLIHNLFFLFSLILLLLLFIFPSFSQQDFKDGKLISLELLESEIITLKNDSVFYIKNGTYSDVKLRISYSGNKRIVISAETPGKVVLKGESVISILDSKNIVLKNFLFYEIQNKNSVEINNSSFIKIENNYFYKCGFQKDHSILFIVNGSFSNQIYRNTFDGSKAMSVVISGRHKNLKDRENLLNEISYNYFYNIPRVSRIYPGQNNGLEAIQIGQGTSNSFLWELETKVHHNLFEKIIGDAAEIISIKSSYNEIYNNTLLNNQSGISIRFGNKNVIRENYFYNTTRGIRAFGNNQVIFKNIIINPEVGIQLPSANFSSFELSNIGGYYQSTNNIIKDNYIEGALESNILIGFGHLPFLPRKITVKGNLIYKSNNPCFLSLYHKVKKGTINKKKTNKFISDFHYSQLDLVPDYSFESLDNSVGVYWKKPID